MFHSEILSPWSFLMFWYGLPGIGRQLCIKMWFWHFFHTQNICHGAWKILRTTLCCFVVLQSRGEGLKSKENFVPYVPYGTKFSMLCKPSPRDWVLRIFHAPWHIFCVWKNARTTFWCIVFSQSRGDCSKTSWTQDLRVKRMSCNTIKSRQP